MYAIHRILLAIKDPRAKSHAALDKTAQLALGLGAEVRLFHGIADPLYLDASGAVAQVYPDLEQDRCDWYRKRLETLAKRLRRRGIKASTTVRWDYPSCESIIREAARFGADLIVAECHPTAHHAPWLVHFADWELQRKCTTPVLLIKSRRRYHRPKVLAAFDPARANGKPANLDEEVLRYASTIAQALHGALHALHSYEPTHPRPLEAKNEAWHAAAGLTDLLRWSAVPEKQRHVVPGHAVDAIEEVAGQLDTSIVALGTISRSGLSRLIVGNTAEHVLDRLQCDVLIVKPRNFRNAVARQPRGVKMIALPD
jgi:universal stress protein E